uniref:Uncharacterized protein n=1 Tax=Avena sativa TaxID=4498 RepID=A0ACD5TTP0_AVESA
MMTASRGLEIEGYPVEGVSIGGKETCVIFPTLSLAFDIGVGVGPPTAFKQEFLFVSHGHLDHIGGLPAYVAAREFLSLPPPTIFVPACLGDLVAQLFQSYRAISVTDLPHILVPLELGKEYEFRTDLKVRAFKTYHAIPSQGYVIYTMKKKLKQEFIGLPGTEIKRLRSSGVEVTDTVSTPEIAFTGDTTSDFILDPNNSDVLAAKILVVETTFLDNSISVEHAREYGHTHLSEVASQSEKLGNKAILLIHFSARYTLEEIDAAINTLPPALRSRVYAMKEGFKEK